MRPDFFKQLKEYAREAIKLAERYLDLSTIEFDHICYQTVSKKDYLKALKQLAEDIDVIGEIPHAGRMLTLARLKKAVKEKSVTIDTLEIAEPKPKRAVKVRNFDHFSFTVKGDFAKACKNLKRKGVYISEVKQILDHKFVKFFEKEDGVEIEMRNKKLEEAVNNMATEAKKKRKEPSEKEEEPKQADSVSELRKLLEEEKERKLRALADYQNLQKRVQAESRSISTIANAVILGQLLDILDDFDRALENFKVEEKYQVGIRLVRDKLKQVIDANGLELIDFAVGTKLDPNVCEAVGVLAVEKAEEDNVVKEVVQKGYKLKQSGQIVRPVKVIVGKKSKSN